MVCESALEAWGSSEAAVLALSIWVCGICQHLCFVRWEGGGGGCSGSSPRQGELTPTAVAADWMPRAPRRDPSHEVTVVVRDLVELSMLWRLARVSAVSRLTKEGRAVMAVAKRKNEPKLTILAVF